MRSNIEVMVTLKSQRALNLYPFYSIQGKPLKTEEVQRKRSSMPIGMVEEADKNRCIAIQLQMEARPMVVGTWWIDYPMAMGIQWMGIRLMAVGI